MKYRITFALYTLISFIFWSCSPVIYKWYLGVFSLDAPPFMVCFMLLILGFLQIAIWFLLGASAFTGKSIKNLLDI